MDTQRLILLVIFSFSLLMLWEAWEKEKAAKPPPSPATAQGVPVPEKPVAAAAPQRGEALGAMPDGASPAKGEIVRVSTDLIVAEIDTLGGTLKRVELLRHKDSEGSFPEPGAARARAPLRGAERPGRRGRAEPPHALARRAGRARARCRPR